MAKEGTATDVPNRIFLWTNPRSLSTVFEKCVSCMDGADVWHEPYLNSFINHVNSSPELLQRYPKMETTMREGQEASIRDGGSLLPSSVFRYDWVQEQLEAPLKKEKKFLFVMDWPGAIDGHFDKLPKEDGPDGSTHVLGSQWDMGMRKQGLPQVPFKHTFIIRNPRRTAKSYRKACLKFFKYEGNVDEFNMIEGNPYTPIHLPNPNHLQAFWQYVRNTVDPNPVVIDSDDLQNFPEQILRKYCEAVGIPFKTTYLKWDAGKEPFKGINGPLHFISDHSFHYVKAVSSSCFLPATSQPPTFESLTPDEQKYCSSLLPGYQEMYLSRIKPESKRLKKVIS